ncbi:hypothetical protein Golob_012158, partial [Gossypium lobatum]|nr:hypothetical protein [Gossypium lobatum]
MYIGPIEVTKLRMAKVRARKTAVKIFYSKGWHEKVPVVIELDLCAAQLVIILHQGKCMAKASFRRSGGNFCDCLRCSWLL